MKKLLILILSTMSFLGYANAGQISEKSEKSEKSIEEKLQLLESQYNIGKLKIIEQCDHDGQWVQRVAQLRDDGKHIERIFEYSFETIEKGMRKNTINTEGALWQTFIIIWVYSNHKSTPIEIYKMLFEDCKYVDLRKLDFQYEYIKGMLLLELTPLDDSSDPGTDFVDPTKSDK